MYYPSDREIMSSKGGEEVQNILRQCDVPNCYKGLDNEGIMLYSIPQTVMSSKLELKEWMRLLSIHTKPSYNFRICSSHFKDNDFISCSIGTTNIKRKELKANIVPSKNLPISKTSSKHTARSKSVRIIKPDLLKNVQNVNGNLNKNRKSDTGSNVVKTLEFVDVQDNQSEVQDFIENEVIDTLNTNEEIELKTDENSHHKKKYVFTSKFPKLDAITGDSSKIFLKKVKTVKRALAQPPVDHINLTNSTTVKTNIVKNTGKECCCKCNCDCIKCTKKYTQKETRTIGVQYEFFQDNILVNETTKMEKHNNEESAPNGKQTESDSTDSELTNDDTNSESEIPDELFVITPKIQYPDLRKTDNGEYQCQICEKTLVNLSGFLAHVDCHKQRSLLCPICGRMFKTLPKMRAHDRKCMPTDLKYEPQVKKPRKTNSSYECVRCNLIYKTSIQLRRHHMDKHVPKEFECESCFRKFENDVRLRKHIDQNHLKIYRCEICNEIFSLNDYNYHVNSVHLNISGRKRKAPNPMNLTCLICSHQFSINEYKKHFEKLDHQAIEYIWKKSKNIINFECKECTDIKYYPDMVDFMTHRIDEHSSTWRYFTEFFKICNLQGPVLNKVVEHPNHLLPKEYTPYNYEKIYCPICKFRFMQGSYKTHLLSAHHKSNEESLLKQSKIKNLVCRKCDGNGTYTSITNFIIHQVEEHDKLFRIDLFLNSIYESFQKKDQ